MTYSSSSWPSTSKASLLLSDGCAVCKLVHFPRSDILFKRLVVCGIVREWSWKEAMQWLRINCKVLDQTGSLFEFSQAIFEKLNGNSIITRIMT